MPPPDHAHREAARLRLDYNAVVEAGAGTGKTTLLTDRLLFLLLGRGVPIGALVALTFTEKAAGEIKLRLTERLLGILAGEKLAGLEQPADVVETRARAALEDMEKAQIDTIHAFCSHLLRLYPVEAGVDPNLRVDATESALEELFTAEWARFLDVELGEAAPRAEEWIALLKRVKLEELEELGYELCKDESLDLEAVGRPDPAAEKELREVAAALREATRALPPTRGRIAEALEIIEARLEGRADDRELPNASWPKAWPSEGAELYERAAALGERASAADEAAVRAACALLVPFVASFRATFAYKGWISFAGLLRKARDLVRDELSVREQLKTRYQALLIDEFQDTDPLQGELLLFLAEEAGGRAKRWQDVKLAAGKLFIVGDPKQSIYRFRGADIAAYQGFTGHVLKNGKSMACDLTANFRSHEGVIGPVNDLFGKIMQYEPGSQPAYKAIQPQGEPEEGAFRALAVEPGKADEVRRAEAAWTAQWLVENCGEGKPWRYKDAAILLRSTTSLGAVIDAFKARGVPYAVEMERFFYGSPEVRDLHNLLSALDDPGDRVAVAGLLRSPLVALPDRELIGLELNYMKSRKAPPRVAELYAKLRSLRQRVGRVPLGELVGAALAETALLETTARAYHGQQTVANLLKLARMASDAADERGLTLKEFIARVASDMRDSDREGEHPLADDYLDAVRILSIHKSKGLEFPVVFALNLSGRAGGASKKPQVVVDWTGGRVGVRVGSAWNATMNVLHAREQGRQWDESLRLLYVAMTRAKRKLFLLGAAKAESSSLAAWLAEGGAWPPAETIQAVGEAAAAPRKTRSTALPSDAELEPLWKERARRRAEAEARRWTTSATARLAEEPAPAALEEGELAPSAAEPALVGQAVHAALERWDFREGGDAEAAVEAACRRLKTLKPLADWAAVERETLARLRSFLETETARALARAEIVGREVPFVYAEGGTVVRGSIDLLIRENGKLVVIDYKTGKKADYEAQGAVYREAVRRAVGEDCEFRLVYLSELEPA